LQTRGYSAIERYISNYIALSALGLPASAKTLFAPAELCVVYLGRLYLHGSFSTAESNRLFAPISHRVIYDIAAADITGSPVSNQGIDLFAISHADVAKQS
jgi:hypothetical protein